MGNWDTPDDVVRVASAQVPGVKAGVWLYAPFTVVCLLNLQYLVWAACTGGRAWRHHAHAAFSRSFFLLLANLWLTDLVHGGLLLVANMHAFNPGPGPVKPVLPHHLYGNTSVEVLPPDAKWGLVLRLGAPLTIATHALSNMAAIALTMSAQSTLTASSACVTCDVTLTASFRSRVLGIIAGLWALDIVLLFYPLFTHMVGETLFQTLLYAWLAYVGVMAEVWIVVLCGLAYRRARRMHAADPEYCPATVLTSLRHKTFIVLAMTAIIYVTLLPWPVCEVVYTDRKLHQLIAPHIAPRLQGVDTKALYDYLCVLPYLHLLLQSILVIAFPETRWRLCLGQRSAAMTTDDDKHPGSSNSSPPEPEAETESEAGAGRARPEAVELRSSAGADAAGTGDGVVVHQRLDEQVQRTSFLQGSLFAENLEALRAHLEPGGGVVVETEDAERLYYNTLPKETTV